MNTINRVLIAIMLLGITVGFMACGSDDDTPVTGNAVKMVVGTYKGTMKMGATIFENTTLTVVEAGDGKVTVTTDKGSTTSKTIPVTAAANVGVTGNSDAGAIAYLVETKVITVVTSKQKDTDITYTFEGTKQ